MGGFRRLSCGHFLWSALYDHLWQVRALAPWRRIQCYQTGLISKRDPCGTGEAEFLVVTRVCGCGACSAEKHDQYDDPAAGRRKEICPSAVVGSNYLNKQKAITNRTRSEIFEVFVKIGICQASSGIFRHTQLEAD